MFQLLERPPRMLPRMFNPVQLNVDCSAKTPVKEAESKKGKRGKAAKASGESRATRPNSGSGRAPAAGTLNCISQKYGALSLRLTCNLVEVSQLSGINGVSLQYV